MNNGRFNKKYETKIEVLKSKFADVWDITSKIISAVQMARNVNFYYGYVL